MKKTFLLAFGVCCTLSLQSTSSTDGADPKNASLVSFTENKGQVCDQHYQQRPDVLFGGSDGSMTFHLRNNGVSYQFHNVKNWKTLKKNTLPDPQESELQVPGELNIHRLDVNWMNMNPHAVVTGENVHQGTANFYLSHCRAGVTGIHTYAEVMYRGIYDGIDVRWFESEGHLKYDYLVSPGSDYKKIRLQVIGAEELRLNALGQLEITTSIGTIAEDAPLVMQDGRTLPSKWIVERLAVENTFILSFDIEGINHQRAFVIDPLVRSWGTYYGGTGTESGNGAIDPVTGDSFIGGSTNTGQSTVIATSGAPKTTFSGGISDVFIAKFNPAGQRLWGTYYGGTGDDYGGSCTLDANGNSFVCGLTNSSGMSTAGAHQVNYGGNSDLFLFKLNSSGALQWCTYYGGVGTEYVSNCAADPFGNVFICGDAGSTSGIAGGNAHQASKGGQNFPTFLAKFNSAGVRQWGTYYGGDGGASSSTCSTDKQGNAYLVGMCWASTGTAIATPGTHQQTWSGNFADGYIAKFNAAGVRQWGTYLGGPNEDRPRRCFVDTSGNVFVPGSTAATNGISTPGTFQTSYGGGTTDGFLMKFNSSGQRIWGTYYGGAGTDRCEGALDNYGNILLGGTTTSNSGTLIATTGSYKSTYGGGASDMFIAKLLPDGRRAWGSYYGGSAEDVGIIAGMDANDNLFITGWTSSNASITTTGSHQQIRGGGTYDMYLVKFNYCNPPVPVNTTPANNLVICEGETATLHASAPGTLRWFKTQTGDSVVGSGNPFITPLMSAGTYTYYVDSDTCGISDYRTMITFTVLVCSSVSKKELSGNAINVYPNPFKETLFVSTRLEEVQTLKIYNALGAIVFETTFLKEAILTIEHFKPGIYFLQMEAGTRKIIKD